MATGVDDAVSSPSTSTSVRRSGNKRSASARNPSRESSLNHHHHHHHAQHHSLRKQTSVASIRNAWKLKYQDFTLPMTKEERESRTHHSSSSNAFQKLMLKANDWLHANPTVQVRTCESVTWMSSDPAKLGNSEMMMTSRQFREGASTFYSRGLRLWLVPGQASKVHQTLCHEDVVPEAAEKISDLVDKINIKIEKRQLKGRILSVQTVGAPARGGKIESGATSWTDEVDFDSHYVFFLRVFYLSEVNIQPDSIRIQALIGIKDLVPEETDEGYEAFEALIDKTNSWMANQSDIISITNLQSVIIQKEEGPSGVGDLSSGSCGYVMPGVNNTDSIEFFRILRVSFLRRRTGSTSASGPSVLPVAYETITPQLISTVEPGTSGQLERLETMRETFSKAVAFLRNSGAEVVCAETVLNPMHLYTDDPGQGQGQGQRSEDDIQFLFTIRLYVSCLSRNGFNRPPSSSVRRVTSATQLTGPGLSDDEAGGDHGEVKGRRSSPLFLRSVVTRQFKYRWLVLAVSAFSCMAIIVVVSVVYSNK